MRLIDGDALKDRLQSLAYDDWNQGVATSWSDAYRECADMVEDMPTIEPERETGEWIEHHEPYTWMGYTFWSCSNCGFECGYDKEIRIKTNFCPHCGAKMEGK